MNKKSVENLANEQIITLVVDRIEGEFAVCEEIYESTDESSDIVMKNIKLSDIPFMVREKEKLQGHFDSVTGQIKAIERCPKNLLETRKRKIPIKFVRFM